jgi:autotransporter-associated beta strand protein
MLKKSNRMAIQYAGSTYLKALFAASFAAASGLNAATVTWDGGGAGSTDLGLAANWAGDVLPSTSVPDTAQWDGSVSGALALSYATASFAGATGDAGINLAVAATQTSPVSLDSGAVTASFRVNNTTLAAGAGAFTLGDTAGTFNLTLGGTDGQTHTWTNNSSNTATINSDVKFGLGGAGSHALLFTGTGNWQVNGSLTPINTSNLSLYKTGTGQLSLAGGGTFTAGLNNYGGTFGAVLREGTTRITAGTYTTASEFVIGGYDTAGGVGANTNLTMDAGSLTVSNWLSLGRGNGVGAVSSDIVLNNSASLTASNFAAGFDGYNAANMPKTTFTLNGTSTFNVSNSGSFKVGESTGSNATMTLNDSSVVTLGASNTSAANRFIGPGGTGVLTINGSSSLVDTSNSAFSIGFQNGTGTLNLNGGTFNHSVGEVWVGASNTNGAFTGNTSTLNISGGTATVGTLILARGNNNAALMNGTANVTGGTLTSVGDVILGFAGAGNLGKLVIDGGTVNVGTTATKWLQVGTWDTSKGQIDINSGNLNLNTGTQIKMNSQGTVGTNIINQNGGSVTFYSDNATTVGGAGDLDLQRGGSASSSNTYNLNGGTLTVPKITASNTSGSRVFNLNGGTIKVASSSSSASFFNLGSGGIANVRNGGAIINTNGIDVTIPQALTHSNVSGDNATDGGLLKQGTGALTLTGVNTYTGATTVNAGSLVFTGSGAINSSSSLTITGGAKLVHVGSTELTVPVTQTLGTVDGNSGTITSLTVADNVSNVVTAGNGNSGTLYVGTLTFQGDATLNVVATGSSSTRYVTATNLTTTASGGKVVVNATNTSGSWLAGDYQLITYSSFSGSASDFQVGAVQFLSPNQTATITSDDYGVYLHIAGDTLTWTGSQSADWTTTAVGGSKNWNYPSTSTTGEFANNNPVLFDDSATRFGVNLASNVSPSSVIFDNSANDYTLSSTGGFGITGGSLIKNGSSKLTITTSNTFTGTTTVNDGTLQIGDGTTDGSIASSSSIVLTNTYSALVLDIVGSKTYANPITGNGKVQKLGSGTLTLSGANTFNGDLTLDAGTLNINSDGAIGSAGGNFVINGGTIDNTSGALVTTASKSLIWSTDLTFTGTNSLALGNGEVYLTGTNTNAIINVVANTLSVGSLNSDFQGVTKTGAGTLQVASAPNSYSLLAGALNVNEGTLNIGSGDLVVKGLSGSGNIGNGSTTTRWLFVNTDTDSSFTGDINDSGSTGKLGFNKSGTGTLTLSHANYNDTTTVQQGKLVLLDGSSTMTNSYYDTVGTVQDADAILEIKGANLTSNTGTYIWNSSLSIATTKGAAGSVRLSSGSLTTSRAVGIGGSVNDADQAYGVFDQTGGTVSIGGFLALGVAQDRSVYNLSVGSLTMTGAPATIGAGGSGIGVMNLSGTGSYLHNSAANNAVWIAESGFGTLNVSNSAALTIANNGLELGKNDTASAIGIVNLLGGTVTANSVTKPGASATGILNFNGGTLKANKPSTTFINGLTAANVYSGGGTIDNGGNEITIPQALVAPTGNGVSASGLSVSGGGYIGTPLVEITGDGQGATAVASIDASGNLTGITMTNPGTGYTTASFALLKGGNGNTGEISGSAAFVANASGTVTFKGASTTTLNGVNTYTGNSVVNSGSILSLGNTGALKFVPTSNGTSNKVTGGGTAILGGAFNIDRTSAAIADGNSWKLVDVSSVTYISGFTVTGFTPSGTNWTLVDGANTWTYSQTTGTLSLAVASSSGGYSSWATTNGLTSGNNGINQDPDSDGISNILEYVLGGNPLSSSSSILPTQSIVGSNLVLTYSRSDESEADTVQTIEISTDLTNWTTFATPGATSAGTVTVTENGSSADTVSTAIPLSNASNGKLFARLKVTQP